MPDFVDVEQGVCALFKKGTVFNFQGKQYTVLEDADKPTVRKGECKTDVYFKASTGKEVREFKISVKKCNADFLENKISHERAEELFGKDVDQILLSSVIVLKDKFEDKDLVSFDKNGRTEAKSITLGWKFELVNKSNGKLSGKMNLTTEQKVDVYSGSNLPSEKRNAFVNGKIVKDSGVANLITILPSNEPATLDSCLNSLVPIKQFIEDEGVDVYFACKALNYRAEKGKWDGNRPLAVFVDWSLVDGELEGHLNFSEPLLHKGDEIAENVQNLLEELHINKSNFRDLSHKMMPDVKYYIE